MIPHGEIDRRLKSPRTADLPNLNRDLQGPICGVEANGTRRELDHNGKGATHTRSRWPRARKNSSISVHTLMTSSEKCWLVYVVAIAMSVSFTIGSIELHRGSKETVYYDVVGLVLHPLSSLKLFLPIDHVGQLSIIAQTQCPL
jgi:hypothetical protein